jgi:hypothetical protein
MSQEIRKGGSEVQEALFASTANIIFVESNGSGEIPGNG